MITASMPMASTVSTVSRSDSPFLTDELATASESTSADRRLAAVSKERRVRVESSKNSVATILPRSVGTLGMDRRSTSAKASATRRTSAMPSVPRSATERRCRGCVTVFQGPDPHAVVADIDHLFAVGREVLPHVVGSDGQLAVAPVDHHGQLHGPGPSEVVQGVEGGPDGPAGEEHVVDQDHHLSGQIAGDVGDRFGKDGSQTDVVTVEGHVEAAHGDLGVLDLAQGLGHAGGQGDATGLEADQDHVLDAAVAFDDLVGHPRQGALHVSGGHHLGVGNEHAPEGSRVTAFTFGHCSSCPCEPHGTHFTVR